jgi:8-oxo-dGTP pyrophosphatase MutT (NUDIX family)
MVSSCLADLAQRLAHLSPLDDAERAHLTRMWNLATTPAALDRDHFVPGHFTASSFVLSPDEQSLLLIFHGKLHRWLQPGGHVEPGDLDIVATARREVSEEVGLDDLALLGGGAPFDLDIHAIPARKADPQHEHFDVRFLFRASSWQVRAASDAVDVRWVPLGEVGQLESDTSVLRAVAKLRSATKPGARAPRS